jgi:predicted AAA+ superfamily ATPase
LVKHAEDHVLFGGLPEYLLRKDAEYLTDLLESILYKDIMTRHALKNLSSIMDLALLLSRSVGNPLSNRKMARILDLSHTTVSDYISFFLEIKLIDLMESEGKISERKVSPKKIYLTDNGMAKVISPSLNLGALVENLVFNELKKKYEPRYLISNGKEIDFVFEDHAIEVKYKDRITKKDIDPLNKIRGYKKRILITRTESGEMDGVRLLPLYRFLLEGL